MKKIVFAYLILLLLILGCAAPRIPPPVIMEFSTNPSTINTGSTSTLLWSVTGATSVNIDQGIGQVNVAGTKILTPLATTVYTISATNATGTITKSAVVTINPVGPTFTEALEKRNQQVLVPGYLIYTDNNNGFSICYPEGWKSDKDSIARKYAGSAVIAYFYSTYMNGNPDSNAVTCTVSKSGRPTNNNILSFIELAKETKIKQGGEFVSAIPTIIGDTPAIKQIFNQFIGTQKVDDRVVFFLDKYGNVWYISYLGLSFYPNKNEFDTMIDSFRFLR